MSHQAAENPSSIQIGDAPLSNSPERSEENNNGPISSEFNHLSKSDGTSPPVDSRKLARQSRNSPPGRRHPQLASSTDNLLGPQIAPKDKFCLVSIGFGILGITTLLPWNFFITATDYWMYKFRNVTENYDPHRPHDVERTPLQTFFESYLSIAANVPMLISMFLNSLYGQRFSQKNRLYASLSVMLVVFALTTILARIDTDEIQTAFFGFTIFMVVVISLFSAVFQATMFGLVAKFPNNCMHSMVTGQAVAGLLAVLLQTLSLMNNTEPLQSGLWYFLGSTVFLVFAILCYWFMDNEYTRYYLLDGPDDGEVPLSQSMNLIDKKTEVIETIKDSWQPAASVCITFWASLAVFPGVCVLVKPQYPNTSLFTGRYFTTITSFLLFNCGDLAGRVSSGLIPFPRSKLNLLVYCCMIKNIIPALIIFCNVDPRYNTPVLFTNDAIFPILVALTGLTNGYIFSASMVLASINSRRDRLEITGFVMATALGAGLTLGSISSNLILRVI